MNAIFCTLIFLLLQSAAAFGSTSLQTLAAVASRCEIILSDLEPTPLKTHEALRILGTPLPRDSVNVTYQLLEHTEFYERTEKALIFRDPLSGEVQIVAKNEDDTPLENEVIRRSQVYDSPREVMTARLHLYKDGMAEIQREDIGEFWEGTAFELSSGVTTKAFQYVNERVQRKIEEGYTVVAVELIHSHPYFEYYSPSTRETFNYHLNEVDIEMAKDSSRAWDGLVIISAVVPNGYRYIAAYRGDENVTLSVF